MNKFLNLTSRPDRFLLLLLFLCFCTAAFATPTTPTSDFIDNGDGTVTHKLTGLVWMRCSMGQTWTGSTCSGTAKTYTYAQAMAIKTTFANQSDWRLPNIAELHTIVERENYNPAINTTMFPNTPTNNYFWSSSPYASSSDYAWVVGFGYGHNDYDYKSHSNVVRLMRGGQSYGLLPLTTPTTNFTDNKNGTVTHKRTGLTWQRCSVGQTWTGSTCSGTATGYTYEAAMALKSNFAGKNDWRLPNENELLSIAEYGTYNPAINQTIFPNTPINDWFCSSSPHTTSSGSAWIVYFYDGSDNNVYKGNLDVVRLVRGQWASIVASSPNLPDGTIAGDKKGWVDLLSFGNPIGSYQGVTAYMNYADGSGTYQCTDLAYRFATDVFHLAKVAKPNGNKLAAANNGKIGFVKINGKRTDIVMKYYKSGSTTPPINGSIISQTSTVTPGHVSIAKKIVKIDDNTLDVYLFEQNWIWIDNTNKGHIADSRKMRFTKNSAGAWTGKTTLKNKAIGWLNPEAK